eukprot:766736-Prymnesium_polylepis.1
MAKRSASMPARQLADDAALDRHIFLPSACPTESLVNPVHHLPGDLRLGADLRTQHREHPCTAHGSLRRLERFQHFCVGSGPFGPFGCRLWRLAAAALPFRVLVVLRQCFRVGHVHPFAVEQRFGERGQ